jgi:hypothetical protein
MNCNSNIRRLAHPHAPIAERRSSYWLPMAARQNSLDNVAAGMACPRTIMATGTVGNGLKGKIMRFTAQVRLKLQIIPV